MPEIDPLNMLGGGVGVVVAGAGEGVVDGAGVDSISAGEGVAESTEDRVGEGEGDSEMDDGTVVVVRGDLLAARTVFSMVLHVNTPIMKRTNARKTINHTNKRFFFLFTINHSISLRILFMSDFQGIAIEWSIIITSLFLQEPGLCCRLLQKILGKLIFTSPVGL
jgi:hypothetical protein